MATTKKARAKKPASKQTKRTNPAKASAASGNPAKVRRATARDWIAGARLRTLSLAIVPVALGTAPVPGLAGHRLGDAKNGVGVQRGHRARNS